MPKKSNSIAEKTKVQNLNIDKTNYKEFSIRELNQSDFLNDKNFVPNPHEYITVRGAREHNLVGNDGTGVNLIIPKNKMVVFTGLSGSGKSSLVFDTIYAEGQRRYVESLSSYARQFLGLKEKPVVDTIDGLSPAISIDQKSTSNNPRSTVGTVTEIYDYLRLLFARVGDQKCHVCGSEIAGESVSNMMDRIMKIEESHPSACVAFVSPIVEDQKGWHKQHILEAKKNGFKRIRVNGKTMLVEEAESLEMNKQQKHTIEIIVDRVEVKEENRDRILDSLETALRFGSGRCVVEILEEDTSKLYLNKNKACPNGHGAPPELEPRIFSFNSPHGACPHCSGLGYVTEIDEDLIVPNHTLSVAEGCIKPLSRASVSGGWLTRIFDYLSQKYKFSLTEPWKNLSDKQKKVILYGEEKFEGVILNLERRYKESTSEASRRDIESYMNKKVCPECKGSRLKKEALAVTICGKNIAEVCSMSIEDCLQWFEDIS